MHVGRFCLCLCVRLSPGPAGLEERFDQDAAGVFVPQGHEAAPHPVRRGLPEGTPAHGLHHRARDETQVEEAPPDRAVGPDGRDPPPGAEREAVKGYGRGAGLDGVRPGQTRYTPDVGAGGLLNHTGRRKRR